MQNAHSINHRTSRKKVAISTISMRAIHHRRGLEHEQGDKIWQKDELIKLDESYPGAETFYTSGALVNGTIPGKANTDAG